MSVQTSGLRCLAPDAILVNGFNPRRIFNDSDLRELAFSLEQVGVLQPLIVRRVGEAFELVAGERRLRAAKLARLAEVPCLVRDLTDAQALEVAILENLQRQDISALDEAEGFRRLIEAGQFTPDTLAAKLSKSREHVYGRLRLCHLATAVVEALASGEIEPSVAGLLAKFPAPLQASALKSLQQHGSSSFREAKEFLGYMWRPLGESPWRVKKTGAELPELVAGCGACGGSTCSDCLRNSRNMPDMAGLHEAKEVCTDAVCFGEKLDLWGELELARLRAKGREVVEIPRAQWDYSGRCTLYAGPWKGVDERVYDVGTDDVRVRGTTWRKELKGLGYPFAVAQSPSGHLVELVKPLEAQAFLVEKGLVKSYVAVNREMVSYLEGSDRPIYTNLPCDGEELDAWLVDLSGIRHRFQLPEASSPCAKARAAVNRAERARQPERLPGG